MIQIICAFIVLGTTAPQQHDFLFSPVEAEELAETLGIKSYKAPEFKQAVCLNIHEAILETEDDEPAGMVFNQSKAPSRSNKPN